MLDQVACKHRTIYQELTLHALIRKLIPTRYRLPTVVAFKNFRYKESRS